MFLRVADPSSDGMQSDAAGELVVKPCTPAEIAFYEQTLAEHPDFAELIPVFMGTLSLGAPNESVKSTNGMLAPETAADAASAVTAFIRDKQPPTKAAKIVTEQAIVLENLEASFVHPNVIDIKLGARLWADDAPAEKRARHDKVTAETTSGSLHFRIAGMKVWQEDSRRRGRPAEQAVNSQVPVEVEGTIEMEGNHMIYDKLYGRQLTERTISEGFNEFFGCVLNEASTNASKMFDAMIQELTKAIEILEKDHSRMYSCSVLFVYEGDSSARRSALDEFFSDAKAPRQSSSDTMMLGSKSTSALEGVGHENENDEDVEEDDEEDEEEDVRPFVVKLIDFAHATWTPGQGPDENMLTGLRNVRRELERISRQLSS